MEYFVTILINKYDWLWVITLALVAERLLPIPPAYHPTHLFSGIAKQLRQKVLVSSRPASQQLIAGVLATVLMALFILPLPLLARVATPFPQLVDWLILILCLQWRPMQQQIVRFAKTGEQHKQLRRTLLSPWVARDCSQLSDLGMNKAAIEAVYLRSFHDQFALLAWYAIGGLFAALSYYLLLLLSRQWHPRLNQQSIFGKPVKVLRAVLDVLPETTWAFWLLLSSSGHWPSAAFKQFSQYHEKARGRVLLAAHKKLQCDLGGPAIYEQQKVRRPRFSGNHEPQSSDVLASLQQINWHLGLALSLIWASIISYTFWIIFL